MLVAKKSPCYFDQVLKKDIHKFEHGAYVCACGESKVKEKPETDGGWRQIPRHAKKEA